MGKKMTSNTPKMALLFAATMLLLGINTAKADVFCPPSFKCTGNSINTCQQNFNNVTLSPNGKITVRAGTYTFSQAVGFIQPVNPYGFCVYILANDPKHKPFGFKIQTLSSSFLMPDLAISKQWKGGENSKSCNMSSQNAFACPYKVTSNQ